MSPMKFTRNQSSSNYGEAIVRQANVLASCYIVDTVGTLKGLHYCTTGAAGNSSSSNKRREIPGKRIARRGGAALSIREECERFFCERMSAVFHGEMSTDSTAPGLMGAYTLQTPPVDDESSLARRFGGRDARDGILTDKGAPAPAVTAWLEIWDFEAGASFRAFVTDDGHDKTLFVFFDGNIVDADLKQALMALIDLADGALDCQRIVVCLDRRIPEPETKGFMKSLQWVGFDLTTLRPWASMDVTSEEWLFMAMEL
ncbi:ornithine decarboxylase antizyme [Sodiomyces alkalinus F11]|uniref:Ornithine decarboxylase antizyme n=1 Tax=Sodiomyces alkalinus (strain CBS 110278 / VKM F-3762 / F11) TaxID=1314773 RepID=A0A3N2Q4Q0_SODAK|nr:ornithine decarboxylase antizyme [Sodiomyces alkalinus F11]ROT41754.1 ornithine decarboxylase antizyme [Sodiomyces alkalinus F11]